MDPSKAGTQPVGDQRQQPTHRPRSMGLPASESRADLLANSLRTRRNRSGPPPKRQPLREATRTRRNRSEPPPRRPPLREATRAGRKPAGSMRPLPRGRKRPGRKRPGQLPSEQTPSGRTQPGTKRVLLKGPAPNRPRRRSRGSAVVDGPVSLRRGQSVADMEQRRPVPSRCRAIAQGSSISRLARRRLLPNPRRGRDPVGRPRQNRGNDRERLRRPGLS